MKKYLLCFGWRFTWLLVATQLFAQPAPAPRLTLRELSPGELELSWPRSAVGAVPEASDTLATSATWQPLENPTTIRDDQFVVTLLAGAGPRFIRLGQALIQLSDSSPVDGETGVAVTRETILHFTAPLASDTILGTNQFYAGYGGRRLLSRVELAGDRRKATLFYLEPLPGSTRITAVFDGTAIKDEAGVAVDADGDGEPGGQAVISFDTLSLTPLVNTAVIGTVFASELVPGNDTATNAVNRPLAGVTITVDGLEQSVRAVTDAKGQFTLRPVPPGRFFVHIDGRTVADPAAGIRYPDQAFYPSVGKAWDAVAGVTNNLAGGTGTVFLPLITTGTLQPVSLTRDTTITFPPSVVASNSALAGVSLMVPANSLFADNGTRGGKVGIAPVAPDRLPGPLPPGLELPLVITVQTDGGLNFDQPAPICFPNLPNPTTGKAWPPGTKGSLISFNHDEGIWEAVGDMTVSADGKLFCTDPGVGIRQPGWHGPLCPKATSAPPPPKGLPCKRNAVAYAGCFETCRDNEQRCVDEVGASLLASKTVCEAFTGALPENELNKCFEVGYLLALQMRNECYAASQKCQEHCVKCRGSQAPASDTAVLAREGPTRVRRPSLSALDPLKEKLRALGEQIAQLVEPFIKTGLRIPENVLSQIATLRREADAAAGGDAVAYLRGKVAEQEAQILFSAATAGLAPDDINPGDAPPYPVLYSATVARPGGLLILRNQTKPLGQHTLFLPPDGSLLNVNYYDPKTRQFGTISPNRNPQARYSIPRFNLFPITSDAIDSDRDGLPNVVEEIYGTDSAGADTDGDGIPDGAEIEQGTDPLGGLVVRTGVIATVKTPGAAIDIATGNNLAVVAQGASGVAVLNISKSSQPTIIAQVDTPGSAQRVALSGNLVAVADGSAGLAVIDISDPATTGIAYRLNLGAAQAVAVGNGLGYVGLSSGQVFAVDLRNGMILNSVNVTGEVQDLALEGDHLYALTTDRLFVISWAEGGLKVIGSAASPIRPTLINRRLFVGGGIAYATHGNGYNTLTVADPAKPLLITGSASTQFGWRQIVANGSGLGLAAVAPNSADSFPRMVSLYDLSDPRATETVITAFPTPGNARAVSIFNGLAYVADDTAGMQVINYLPYDAKGQPPTITLTTSFSGNSVEEGKSARVTADVGDDVQVRNVEFHVDGVKVFTDSAFPFEFRFVPPRLTAGTKSFRLRARAVDTGGNSTWTEEATVQLLPDTTAPRVLQYSPVGGGKALQSLSAYFDGPVNAATLNAGTFTLVSAGNDGLLDTPDDLPISGGVVSYREETRVAALSFASPLPDGRYRAVLTTAVADLAGNRLPAEYTWQFRVADAVFWIRAADGLWSDPLNWSTGTLPGPNDNVIIELNSAEVTVTHLSGITAIKSLLSRERLDFNSSTLLAPGGIQVSKNLTLDRSTIRGGTVTATDGARLVIVNNIASVLDGVTLVGDLDVTTGSLPRVIIRNGLTLNGSVLVDRGGNVTFEGTQALDSGTIVFGGASGGGGIFFNTITLANNTTLTLGPAVVLRGQVGSVSGNGTIINQGLISADVAGGTLNIDARGFSNIGTCESKNGGSLTLSATTWNNPGVINAAGAGKLTLMDSWTNTGTINANGTTVNLGGTFTLPQLGAFNRTGGTVVLAGVLNLTGDTLVLNATTGSWTLDRGIIRGGTVTLSEGAKLICVNNIPSTLDGVTLNGDLDVTTGSLPRVIIRNGLTLNGSVLVDRGGNITFEGTQALDSGTIVFGGASGGGGIFFNTITLANNTTLTLGPAVVLRGQVGSVSGNGTIINQGLISADVAGGTMSVEARGFSNIGTSECKNGGSLTLRATTWNNTGVINAAGTGALTLADAWSNTGTINASGATVNLGGTFTLPQVGTLNRTGGTVKLTGVLNLTDSTLALNATTGSWTLDRGTINGGTVTLREGARLICVNNIPSFLDGVTLDGDLDLTSNGARVFIRNGLTLNGSVLLDLGGNITFEGHQTFGSGNVIFRNGSPGFNTPNSLTIAANTTLTLGPAVTVRGRLGTINGTGTLINQGLISADVAGGTITISPKQFVNTGTVEQKNGGRVVAP